MRRMTLVIAVLVAQGGVACAGTPSEVEGETLVTGAPARIILDEQRWAGGQGVRLSTSLDSATARYAVTYCEESPGGPTCAETTETRSGSSLSDVRDRIFADATSAEFRALRPEYRTPSGAQAPDYQAGSLTVIANERSRTIRWERGAAIPPVLSRFLCLMAVARGELVSCAV